MTRAIALEADGMDITCNNHLNPADAGHSGTHRQAAAAEGISEDAATQHAAGRRLTGRRAAEGVAG
jgi:hypothetical protein